MWNVNVSKNNNKFTNRKKTCTHWSGVHVSWRKYQWAHTIVIALPLKCNAIDVSDSFGRWRLREHTKALSSLTATTIAWLLYDFNEFKFRHHLIDYIIVANERHQFYLSALAIAYVLNWLDWKLNWLHFPATLTAHCLAAFHSAFQFRCTLNKIKRTIFINYSLFRFVPLSDFKRAKSTRTSAKYAFRWIHIGKWTFMGQIMCPNTKVNIYPNNVVIIHRKHDD